MISGVDPRERNSCTACLQYAWQETCQSAQHIFDCMNDTWQQCAQTSFSATYQSAGRPWVTVTAVIRCCLPSCQVYSPVLPDDTGAPDGATPR